MAKTPTLRELISQGPVGGGVVKKKPIGVPEDFSLPGPAKPAYELGEGRIGPVPHVPTTITAQYFEGDELVPASMSVEERARWQRRLASVGLLDPKEINGVWTKASRDAYKELLAIANASGMDKDAALAQFPVAAAARAKQQTEVNVVNLSDPAALRKVLNETAREVLGRKATAKQEEMFVKAIQRLQTGAQTKAFEAGVAAKRSDEMAATAPATPSEFTPDTVLGYAQQLAEQYGLRITSTKRSPERNKAVGGAPNSDHLTGMAVDFSGSKEQMEALAQWARGSGQFRYVGWGDKGHRDHVHLSFKGGTPVQAGGGSNIRTASVTTVMPDPSAQAEETLRKQNPVEAGAHDIATTFDTFQKIIGGKF